MFGPVGWLTPQRRGVTAQIKGQHIKWATIWHRVNFVSVELNLLLVCHDLCRTPLCENSQALAYNLLMRKSPGGVKISSLTSRRAWLRPHPNPGPLQPQKQCTTPITMHLTQNPGADTAAAGCRSQRCDWAASDSRPFMVGDCVDLSMPAWAQHSDRRTSVAVPMLNSPLPAVQP